MIILISVIGLMYIFQERIKAWFIKKITQAYMKSMSRKMEQAMPGMGELFNQLGEKNNGKK